MTLILRLQNQQADPFNIIICPSKALQMFDAGQVIGMAFKQTQPLFSKSHVTTLPRLSIPQDRTTSFC